MTIRPYQQKAIDQIRADFRAGNKKLLLHLATGAGKTFVFSQILKGCEDKGTDAIMIVRSRKLVSQASERLKHEGIRHGVMMSGHPLWHPLRKIQICSIDTLRSRKLFPRAKILIIDEAHMASSKSFIDFLKHYSDSFILGVTATPYIEKDFRHIATKVIAPISIKELIKQKYLVPAKYYVPAIPNLKGISINHHDKDYNKSELSSRMSGTKIVGKVVEHWKMLGENRPTLCFAVTIEHSLEIVSQFKAAGIPAAHCDANSPDAERNAQIEKLRTGKIKVLSNVGLFGVGVDMPFLSCIIMARPTRSLALYIQQAGRGARPCPETGKQNFIILDHSGNVPAHGVIDTEYTAVLDGGPPKQNIAGVMICRECYAAFEKAKVKKCPSCGHEGKPSEGGSRNPEVDVDNFLSEYYGGKEEDFPTTYPIASEKEIFAEIARLDKIAGTHDLKPGFVWHSLKKKYGSEAAKKYLSDRFRRSTRKPTQSIPPSYFEV